VVFWVGVWASEKKRVIITEIIRSYNLSEDKNEGHGLVYCHTDSLTAHIKFIKP
jgi:hypothetical protein